MGKAYKSCDQLGGYTRILYPFDFIGPPGKYGGVLRLCVLSTKRSTASFIAHEVGKSCASYD